LTLTTGKENLIVGPITLVKERPAAVFAVQNNPKKMTAPKFLLLVPGVPSPRSACSTTCAMIFLLAPFIAIADQSWTGTVDIQWTTPGNWSGNSPPGAGDMAVYSGAF